MDLLEGFLHELEKVKDMIGISDIVKPLKGADQYGLLTDKGGWTIP